MKRRIAFVSALTLAAAATATPAHAQETLLESCGTVAVTTSPNVGQPPAEVRDQFQFMCGQVVSALTNVQPTIGIAFSGGNHVLGSATTIGRRLGFFPRVSVTARLNIAVADAPDLLDGFSPTLGSDGQVPAMGTSKLPVGSLQGDAQIGLFNGFSLGPAIGGVGSVDLLASVSFIPAVEQTGLAEDIMNYGLGARVGILRQGLLMPGVSVSGMYRKMGDVGFGDIAGGDPAEFSTDLTTTSLRLAASKGLLMFDLAAGAGYDIYSSDVAFDWRLTCPAAQCPNPGNDDIVLGTADGVSGEMSTAAWNVFANAGLSLLLLNVVGEVGYQKVTDVIGAEDLQGLGAPDQAPTVDDLSGGRFFASIGLRLTI